MRRRLARRAQLVRARAREEQDPRGVDALSKGPPADVGCSASRCGPGWLSSSWRSPSARPSTRPCASSSSSTRHRLTGRTAHGPVARLTARDDLPGAVAAVRSSGGSDDISQGGDALVDLATILAQAGQADQALTTLHDAIALYDRTGNVVGAERVPPSAAPTPRGRSVRLGRLSAAHAERLLSRDTHGSCVGPAAGATPRLARARDPPLELPERRAGLDADLLRGRLARRSASVHPAIPAVRADA